MGYFSFTCFDHHLNRGYWHFHSECIFRNGVNVQPQASDTTIYNTNPGYISTKYLCNGYGVFMTAEGTDSSLSRFNG